MSTASKFRIQRIRQKVRVMNLTMFNDTFIELDKDQADLIDQWVTESELGRRVAWDMWKLNNKEAVTLFLIKWGS